MNTHRRRLALVAMIAPWLAARAGPAAAQASAPGAPGARAASDDLVAIRAIAVDALQLARSGDLRGARARVEALEVQWRRAEPRMRSLSPQRRQAIDTAIDRVERELRFRRVRSSDSAAALQTLIDVIDASM
ncbi:MAG TPA: hypothetical protein VGO85_16000 [Caldimonas sp.]|jgi:hypothetical protein|nr:hypothetical protein [Caldimonas sp.]